MLYIGLCLTQIEKQPLKLGVIMSKTLNILWTNDNPLTVEFMVFMYATNSLRKKFWEEVHVLAWGATAMLLAKDKKVQELVKTFIAEGGQMSACRACAEKLDIVEELEAIEGLELFYVGEHFTKIIKDDEKLLTL